MNCDLIQSAIVPDPDKLKFMPVVSITFTPPATAISDGRVIGELSAEVRFVPDLAHWVDGVGGPGKVTIDGHEIATVESFPADGWPAIYGERE